MTNMLTPEEFAARNLTNLVLSTQLHRIADEPRWLPRPEKDALIHEAARRLQWHADQDATGSPSHRPSAAEIDRPMCATRETRDLLKSKDYDHQVAEYRAKVHSFNVAFQRWDSLTSTEKMNWRSQFWTQIELAVEQWEVTDGESPSSS